MAESKQRPVLSGLGALLAVALLVGGIAGIGVLFVSSAVGLDDAGSSAGSPDSPTGSLYLPEPEETETQTGPLVTLQPGEPATTAPPSPTDTPSTPESDIELNVAQTSVSAMQQIDLSGSYFGGEGAILQVQRLEGGSWEDFPVTVSVNGTTFSTYVQTSQSGLNRFRVTDTDTQESSNVVKVSVG